MVTPDDFLPAGYKREVEHPLLAPEFFEAHNGGKDWEQSMQDKEAISAKRCADLMQKYAEYKKVCRAKAESQTEAQ